MSNWRKFAARTRATTKKDIETKTKNCYTDMAILCVGNLVDNKF